MHFASQRQLQNSSADDEDVEYGNTTDSLPSKIEILMEKEEIDHGNHDLYDRDEGWREHRPSLLHAPRHQHIAHSGPHDSLKHKLNIHMC